MSAKSSLFASRPGIFNSRSIFSALLLLAAPGLAAAQPSFSKSFSPATIGPGSASLLVFTIDNSGGGSPATGMGFTDTLPAGMVLADPAAPTTDCGPATLMAPDGGGTITFSDGEVAAGATCTVEVLVTSSNVGTHTNVSGDLTSSAGNSGAATADLTVATDRPGFTKSFSPSSVPFGSRSTLTFTIDNSANGTVESGLEFTDDLPAGLEIADPAGSSHNCNGALTAPAGGSTVTYFGGFVAANSSCTITLDVTPAALGRLDNRTSNLTFIGGSSGLAVDTLESTAGDIMLVKEFLADPVPPGGTVDLEFTILNRTRFDDATDIAFTDDLGATLSGLVATGLPMSVCGGTVSGTSTLSFAGGTVAAASECSFTVTLQVPSSATPGIYPNTTTNIEADLGFGEPSFGNQAQDDLFVFAAPVVEKTFLDDPVAAGDSTRMEFTITNTSATSTATDIAFTDDLTTFLSIIPNVSNLPANGFCGGSSSISYNPTFGTLTVNGASLAALDSCTFEVTVDIPAGFSSGVYTNSTSEISATVDGDSVTGNSTSADLEVVGGPALVKEFTDDPVTPGETVTLQFSLTHDSNAPSDATGITFTDDLDATLTGLTSLGLPANDVCGAGSQISESGGVLTLTGGTLTPGESCQFDITLQVPAGASANVYTNTTSEVSSTVSGFVVTAPPASDDLTVAGLTLAKAFTDDPVIPGGSVTLQFSLENAVGAPTASDIAFQDDLGGVAPGLTFDPASVPATPCGASSGISLFSGDTVMQLSGGSLAGGESCQFALTVNVSSGVASGTYGNVTNSFSATIDGSSLSLANAADQLAVESELLLLSKQFVGDPVQPGDTLTLEIDLTNQSATETVNSIALTDDLDAALPGMTVGGVISNGCGFNITSIGGSVLSLTDGSLAPSESCTVVVETEIPAAAPAGLFTNTTSEATGDVGGLAVNGIAASDDFRVVATNFTKSFDGPATATGSAVLTFTLTNLDSTSGIDSLAFTDDLDAVLPGLVATGLPASDVCGAGSSVSGTGFLTFTGGELAAAGNPGDSCSFSVTVDLPAGAAPGTYPNSTSQLTSSGLVVNDPATADLEIEPPPVFSKVFDPAAIPQTGVTALIFTIDNSASSLPATDLAFTDDLPAGVVVAATPDATTDCSGGTLTAAAGTGSITYSGGSLAAGATCTVSVDITSDTPDSYTNVSGALTSSLGDSGTATAELTVTGGEFTLSKGFTDPVLPGGVVDLRFTLVTGAASGVTGVTFTDDLEAVLTGLTAVGLPADGFCGAGSQITGTNVLTVTGSEVPADSDCTFNVILEVPADAPEGSHTNTTSTVSGERLGDGLPTIADPATASLEVVTLGFTKTLDPTIAAQDSTVTATFTITNPDPNNTVSALTFSDDLDAFVPGMTAANTPINDPCGTGSLIDGGATVTLTGGELAGGGSCTFDVTLNVPAGTSGDFTNTTSLLTGEVGGTEISVAAASANLEIEPPPTFTKTFAPDTIGVDDISTLTFTIDNADSTIAANDLAFTDALPAGVSVASTPNSDNTCDGTLTAAADSGTIQLSGGSVAAEDACTLSVDVTASAEGSYANVSDPLTSSSGDSGTASAVLQVADTEFTVSKAFSSQPVIPGGRVDLEITIDNSSAFALNDIALSDDLEAALTGLAAEGLPLSDVCGIGSEVAGSSVVSLTDGSLPAGENCTMVIPLRVPTDASPGTFSNTTGTATGTRDGINVQGAAASADLVVEALGFEKTIAPQDAAAGSTIDINFVISNPDPVNSAEGLTFSDDLDAFVPGMTSDDTPQSDVCGTGSLLDGNPNIQLTGGIAPASGSCTISVTASIPADIATGDYTNQTSILSGQVEGSAFDYASASAPLGVQGAPGFTKSFEPEHVGPGETSTLTFTIDNSASTFDADSLAFVDPLPSGMQVASESNVSNTCGGTLSAAAGADTISLTNGSVAAEAQCTISVDISSSVGGTRTNTTDDLTSSLGNSGPASATLVQFITVPTIDIKWMLALAMLLMFVTWFHTRKY